MNFSIGKKLATGFGIVIIFWLSSSYFSYTQIQKIGESLSDVTSRTIPMDQAASEMEINLIGTGFALEGYLNDRDPLHLERMEKDHQDIEEALVAYRKFAQDEMEQSLAVQMTDGYQRFRQQALTLVTAHNQQSANLIRLTELFRQLDTILDEQIEPAIKQGQAQSFAKLNAAMELEINVNGIAKGLGMFLSSGLPDSEARIEKDTQDFHHFLQQYQNLNISDEEQGWARDIDQLFDEVTHLISTVVILEKTKAQGVKAFVKLRRELDVLLDDNIQVLAARDLAASEKETVKTIARTSMLVFVILAIGASMATVTAVTITRTTVGPIRALTDAAKQVQKGDFQARASVKSRDETGILASAFNTMVHDLKEKNTVVERQDWLKTGIARLNSTMGGDLAARELASEVICEISTFLDAQVGAIYVAGNGTGTVFSLMASYAYNKRKNLSKDFKPGEGLVGQAALERQQILVRNVPEDYLKVTSGLGGHTPRFICVTPFLFEGRVKGVVEIGTLNEISDQHMEYLAQAMPIFAIAVESAQSKTILADSLEESQRLSEELQSQQEELQGANQELEGQAQRLRLSEQKLTVQQEELKVTNEELEDKTGVLEGQKKVVEQARADIEKKAEELALASKYKSEFLANMSHELRTPLNSLLLLAQSLAQNKDGNLTGEQTESARIIHGSGSDLLSLINEILDLSKIEAGHMDLQVGAVLVSDLAKNVRSSFGHMAEDQGLKLEVVVSKDAPAEISTDRKRVEQTIRNLVSNAIKFTQSGSVEITFSSLAPGTELSTGGLVAGQCLAIEVKDTGIGIAPDQQKVIFEAFQQVEGGSSRKFGGTGLGLAISRELVRLLGGEIQLESALGQGSTFTLYFPVAASATLKGDTRDDTGITYPTASKTAAAEAQQQLAAIQIDDDREQLKQHDQVILLIEDDPKFARLLLDKCHEKGFKCLAAPSGEAGLELAARILPSAVILDISLPGMDGWAVLSTFKEDTRTRHIPVHIISAEEASTKALRRGAVGHAVKPLAQEDLEDAFHRLEEVSGGKRRTVLVVEDDAKMRRATVKLIGTRDTTVHEASTGAEALEMLRSGGYACVVLDLKLPDMDGDELLATLKREEVELPPVIVHTARDLTRDEEQALHEHAGAIVIKDVRSQERLLDEVSLFLHRVVSKMPKRKQKMIRDLHDSDALLRDKKVLVVDDDMRTTFAMSRLLSERGIQPLKANNGEAALRLLKEQPDVALVLMDIMMPVMDGYEAMRLIRAQKQFHELPIIALTAKAMPEDREKCLAAGASDYLPKPVDVSRLISMMRVWMYR